MSTKWDTNESVQRFREYLQIPSVHPDIDYDDCVKFLRRQAAELDLPVAVYELVAKKPVVVITWEGSQPELTSIMINSHMDVVPVYEEHWTHPPFAAYITDDGWIYARGTQDMKSVGIIHLETVRRMKQAGVKLKRTVHITFVPDEEIGGVDGMKVFTESQHFKDMNVGFALDESGPCVMPNAFYAFNVERTCRQITVKCKGNPSHGALLEVGTAGDKIYYMIDKFMTFRNNELKRVQSGTFLGDVTTVNLTQLEGGVQANVLPESLSVTFDIRIAPDVDLEEFDKMIEGWCNAAGEGVTFEYLVKNPQCKCTNVDGSVQFWTALKETVTKMGLEVNCVTCPGATDMRYVRAQGVPAINFTPIRNTPLLLHAHDERLHVDEFLNGIDVMEKVLDAVANS